MIFNLMNWNADELRMAIYHAGVFKKAQLGEIN